MGTRFPKPKHFQEVHPWSVNILGLDIPWDSLPEMCEWVLETPVEVEHVSWDFQPERALLSSGYVSYLPGVIPSPQSLGFLFCKTQMVILRGKG